MHLFFLWIPDAELAVARIKDRVAAGGHNVPAGDVHRRFKRSICNFFKLYQPLLDSWMLFNNAGPTPALIAKTKNGQICVANQQLFDQLQALAR